MPEAYIVDALRTPSGRRKGGLSQIHAPTWAPMCCARWSSATAFPKTTTTT